MFFARDPYGCDVARKATWQSHAGPRSAYAARCDMYIIYILLLRVIVHISIPYFELANPSYLSHLINQFIFFNFLSVGLSSTRKFKLQVTWPKEEPWIKRQNDQSVWIAWTRGPPESIKRTCFKEGVTTASI